MILRFLVVLSCNVHILAFDQLLHVVIRRILIHVMTIQFLVLLVLSWLLNYVLAGRNRYLMFGVRLKRTRFLVGRFVESAFCGVFFFLGFDPDSIFFFILSLLAWHRLMGCGFHHCERLCHNDECGNCSAPCGKTRKSWYV